MSPGTNTGTPIPSPSVISSETVYDFYEEATARRNSAVSLSRYAKLIGYDEAAFWGVFYENQPAKGCDPLWDEYDRMRIYEALQQAQGQLERTLGYFLTPTWVTSEEDRFHISKPNRIPQQIRRILVSTKYPKVIEPGIKAEAYVGTGLTLTVGDTVFTLSGVTLPSTNLDEYKILYPDSMREIEPSKITLTGSVATFEIPRFRLVKSELWNTPEGGIAYDVDSNFITEVDLLRTYTDSSTQAFLLSSNCTSISCGGSCEECSQTACIYVKDSGIGALEVFPATYVSGSWTRSSGCSRYFETVGLNYKCGLTSLSPAAEKAIVRLAHVNLGEPPCSCDKITGLWKKDNEIPNFLTKERINCPYGLSNGAWEAYKWALSLSSYRMTIF